MWLAQTTNWPIYPATGRLVLSGGGLFTDPDTAARTRELEKQINDLRTQRDAQATAWKTEKSGSEKKEKEIKKLQTTVDQLEEKERLSFLLHRVNQKAQALLLKSKEFQKEFVQSAGIEAYVVSVDIRRSTELMLKARKPDLFALFITTLSVEMMEHIKNCYGIFDKFTGDGVLAFFPEFYSGRDAGYRSITAAAQCHEAFRRIYRDFRKSFNSVLTDVGLGIGIDYGLINIVQMAGGLTVVGAPVVYACRMAGGPAEKTLLNQPAFEKISEKFSANVFIRETEIDIKHEGRTLAYEVCPNGSVFQPSKPNWEIAEEQVVEDRK